jgi:hypothetical protein
MGSSSARTPLQLAGAQVSRSGFKLFVSFFYGERRWTNKQERKGEQRK